MPRTLDCDDAAGEPTPSQVVSFSPCCLAWPRLGPSALSLDTSLTRQASSPLPGRLPCVQNAYTCPALFFSRRPRPPCPSATPLSVNFSPMAHGLHLRARHGDCRNTLTRPPRCHCPILLSRDAGRKLQPPRPRRLPWKAWEMSAYSRS